MGLIGKVLEPVIKLGLRQIRQEIYTNYIKTGFQVLPPGIDAVPIEGDQGVAIVIDSTPGKSVHIGVYPDPQADTGEVRLYSRDDDGNQKAFLWVKKDGTLEVNGSADFAVAFNDLKSGFDSLKSDFNTFVTTIFNLHTHVSAGPGVPTAVPVPVGSPSAASIDASKVATVKLP